MERKFRIIVIVHGIVSIIAFMYFFLPFYTLVVAPFLLLSIGLAASSRFNLAYKFGFVWIAIIGALFIPLYLVYILSPASGYVAAIISYLSLGFVFYL